MPSSFVLAFTGDQIHHVGDNIELFNDDGWNGKPVFAKHMSGFWKTSTIVHEEIIEGFNIDDQIDVTRDAIWMAETYDLQNRALLTWNDYYDVHRQNRLEGDKARNLTRVNIGVIHADVLQKGKNQLLIEAVDEDNKAPSEGTTGTLDDFLIRNVVIFYKTLDDNVITETSTTETATIVFRAAMASSEWAARMIPAESQDHDSLITSVVEESPVAR